MLTVASQSPIVGVGLFSEGRLAKFIYMDEAGTDAEAPVTVVAGVIIDPDNEWDLALEFLRRFKDHLPDVPDSWSLHATELYSDGKTLSRDKYEKELRLPVLEALFQLPRFLKFPIFFAYQWKGTVDEANPQNDVFMRHQLMFLGALKSANGLMSKAFPGERASVTAEDVPEKRQILSSIPIMLRMAGNEEGIDAFHCIVDTPNFVGKQGAPHLALADALAFAVRLYLSGHKDGPWAMQHVFGVESPEIIFKEGRKHAGASYALDWRWLEREGDSA